MTVPTNMIQPLETLREELATFPPNRERALASTKLDEFQLWVEECMSPSYPPIGIPQKTQTK